MTLTGPLLKLAVRSHPLPFILSRGQDFRSRLAESFLRPAPPLQVLTGFGHLALGGEQSLFIAKLAKDAGAEVLDALARFVALDFGDSYVDDNGSPFPGLGQLSREDLETPAMRDVLDHVAKRPQLADHPVFLEDLRELTERATPQRAIPSASEVLATHVIIDRWNEKLLVYELDEVWLFVSWSTSA